jgi:ATP-dependent protease ClpP protease subunit
MRRVDIPRPANTASGPVRNLQKTPDRSWFRLVNHDNGAPELHIYDEIGFWGVCAEDFVATLNEIRAPELTLRINSPGGEVFEGLVIYNALLDHPSVVNVVVDGMAASAASFVAQAGDHVTMNRGAQMMIHDASGICIGNAGDMDTMRDLLDKLSGEIAGIYAARAGGDREEWRERMRGEMWLTASEAVDTGLADQQADTPPRRPGEDPDEPETDPDGARARSRFDLTALSTSGRFRYPGRDSAPTPVPVPVNTAGQDQAQSGGDPGAEDETPRTEDEGPPVAGGDPGSVGSGGDAAGPGTAPDPDHAGDGPDPGADPPEQEGEQEGAREAVQDTGEPHAAGDDLDEVWAGLTQPLIDPSQEDVFAALRERLL